MPRRSFLGKLTRIGSVNLDPQDNDCDGRAYEEQRSAGFTRAETQGMRCKQL